MYMYIHIERLSNRFVVFRQTDLRYFVKQICALTSSQNQCSSRERMKHWFPVLYSRRRYQNISIDLYLVINDSFHYNDVRFTIFCVF